MGVDVCKIGKWLKEQLLADVELRLKNGEPVTIMVRGWSMFPLLRNVVDKVELFPITAPLKCGDVVVFKYGERVLLHRIVKKRGKFLLIKGDGVPFHYETALCSDVLAVMKTVIKPSGKVIRVDSKTWQKRSRRWNALPPFLQYLIIKPMVFLDRLFDSEINK